MVELIGLVLINMGLVAMGFCNAGGGHPAMQTASKGLLVLNTVAILVAGINTFHPIPLAHVFVTISLMATAVVVSSFFICWYWWGKVSRY